VGLRRIWREEINNFFKVKKMGIGVGGTVLVLTLNGYQPVNSLVGSMGLSVLSQFANNTGQGTFNGFVACNIVSLGVGEVFLINTDNESRFLRAGSEQLIMAQGGPKMVKDLKPTDKLVPFGNATPAQYQTIIDIVQLNDEELFDVQVDKNKNCIANGLTIINA
jgi:hypothetical protein